MPEVSPKHEAAARAFPDLSGLFLLASPGGKPPVPLLQIETQRAYGETSRILWDSVYLRTARDESLDFTRDLIDVGVTQR